LQGISRAQAQAPALEITTLAFDLIGDTQGPIAVGVFTNKVV